MTCACGWPGIRRGSCDPLGSGRQGAELLVGQGDWAGALDACDLAIAVLPRLAWGGLTFDDRLHALSDSRIRSATRRPSPSTPALPCALEILEHGRGQLLAHARPNARRGTPCTLTAWLSERGCGVPVLSDEAWDAVSPLIPVRFAGLTPRRVLDGVLHKVRIGCRWTQLPKGYGHYRAVQGQLQRWRTSGVLDEVLEALANFPSTPLVPEDLTPPLKLTGTLIPELLLGVNPHSAESSRRPRWPGRGVRAAWLSPSGIA